MIWHVSHITCRHLRRESLRADRCAAARTERREAPVERSGAEEESVGTTKEARADGGNAHGETDARSGSQTPVREG